MKKLIALFIQLLLLCSLVAAPNEEFWAQEDVKPEDISQALSDGTITPDEVLEAMQIGRVDPHLVLPELIQSKVSPGVVKGFFAAQKSLNAYEKEFKSFVDLPKLQFKGEVVTYDGGVLSTSGHTVYVDEFNAGDSVVASPDGWVINGDTIPGTVAHNAGRVYSTEIGGKSFVVDFGKAPTSAGVVFKDGKLFVTAPNVLIRPRSPVTIVGGTIPYQVDLSLLVLTGLPVAGQDQVLAADSPFRAQNGIPAPIYVEGGAFTFADYGSFTIDGGAWYTQARIRGVAQEVAFSCIAPNCHSTVRYNEETLRGISWDPALVGPEEVPQMRTSTATLAIGNAEKGVEIKSLSVPSRVVFDDGVIERLIRRGDIDDARGVLSDQDIALYLGSETLTNPKSETRLGAYSNAPLKTKVNGKEIEVVSPQDFTPILQERRESISEREDEIRNLMQMGRLDEAESKIRELAPLDRAHYLGELAAAHTTQSAQYDTEGNLIISDRAKALSEEAHRTFVDSGVQVAVNPLAVGGALIVGGALLMEVMAPAQGVAYESPIKIEATKINGLYSDGEYGVYSSDGKQFAVKTEAGILRYFEEDAVLAFKGNEWFVIKQSDLAKFNTPEVSTGGILDAAMSSAFQGKQGVDVAEVRKQFVWRPTKVSAPQIDSSGAIIGSVQILAPSQNVAGQK